MQKLSKKQRKRIFVCCSKMPYFRAFLHIPTSRKKCAEIFNSRTGHQLCISQMPIMAFARFFFYHENVLCPLFGLFSGYIVLTGAILRKKTERTVNCCFWRKNNRPVFRAVTYLILCFSIAVVAVVGIFCSILIRQVIFDPLCHHKR